MARNPREFLRFMLENLQPLLDISSERRRFATLEDVEAPFRGQLDERAHVRKRIEDMVALGLLIPAAGEWVMPGYIREFLQRLQEQHTASAPGIVKAIIGQLQETIETLSSVIDHSDSPEKSVKAERALRQCCELFYDAVDRIEQTCMAIESEVGKYRAAKDNRQIKASLKHLLDLYEEYLVPLVSVIDLNGLFVTTSNQLARCCERIMGDVGWTPEVTEYARVSLQTIAWQRLCTLQSANAARQELEPLYQIALRDSQLSKGINRLHTLFSNRDDALEGVLTLARIEESREARYWCNESIRNEFRRLQGYVPPLPPLLTPTTPMPGKLLPQFRELQEELSSESYVPDLMEWLAERCGRVDADHVLKCLSRLYFQSGKYMAASGATKSYEFDLITIEAYVWEWRTSNGE